LVVLVNRDDALAGTVAVICGSAPEDV